MNYFAICSTSHRVSHNFLNNGIYAVGGPIYKVTAFSVSVLAAYSCATTLETERIKIDSRNLNRVKPERPSKG